ncbi:MAG: YjbQ family protein [Nitrospirae bacterium]|nr:MAG: YjbQ family protein [Nitrospirota bacterium]
MIKISISTPSHEALIPITDKISKTLPELGIKNGLLHIFVLHTTCGLTINENADPSVAIDILNRLDKMTPWKDPDDRHIEGNSAAHLKSSILGSSLLIPVKDGSLVLGTWQGIFLAEFDGPRTRKVILTPITCL